MLNLLLHSHLRIWNVFLLMLGAIFLSAVSSSAVSIVTLPDHELLHPEFNYRYGPGSFSRTDLAGPGVQFDFTGLSLLGATGVGDNYPVRDIGQVIPSHGNGDFSIFDAYELAFTNLGSGDVTVSLIMNTGFTGPSGTPPNDWTNDTFWQSFWATIPGGQTATLKLDFDYTVPYNIADNKHPHTTGTDGVATAINAYDRTEVSNIGFQILGSGDAEILVQPIPEPIPEPMTFVLLASGLFGLCVVAVMKRRKKAQS
jgi:hypothetical protein